jgi:hypothetical protein
VYNEVTISLGSYYGAAIPRAFWAGWDWAFGQGLLLTILLGIGALFCTILYALIRAIRRSHSWQAALSHVGQALGDFLIAGVGAVAIVLLCLFGWFFVHDAPKQIAQREQRIAELGGAPDAPIELPALSRAERDETVRSLDWLLTYMGNDAKPAYDTAMEVRAKIGMDINVLDKSSAYAQRVKQIYQLAQDLRHKLLGFDNKSGILNSGNPAVVKIMAQAVQLRDGQTIIDFMQSSAMFSEGLETLHKTEGDPDLRGLLFDGVHGLLSKQEQEFDKATEQLGVLIDKTNARVAEIKHGL